ncbi:MAG TPA: LytTR family DNA-binding domain-containing protein [Saprospiraceae bacterium]|nr:LytTR family DNA-binding domain-containing protein [Saprospiraceae bacterium]
MKVIIIEDEMLSAEHLELLLKRIDPEISIIGIFDSVKKSITEFEKGLKADLLFVDIHLADGLSFEIFSKISIETPVIFTTAFDEYAIQAFKVNSIDYLLKPIGLSELQVAVDKFKKWNLVNQKSLLEQLSHLYSSFNKQYKTRFMVKMGDQIVSIKAEDILHFIAEDGIVLLMSKDVKRYPVDFTLDQIDEMLDPTVFFRINRKVIININAIQKVTSYFNSRLKVNAIQLSDDSAIVSRDRVSEFKMWLDR